jgi:hypothetical protein
MKDGEEMGKSGKKVAEAVMGEKGVSLVVVVFQ